jgi:serine/threonine-protein phosphatase 2A regulatory subunit B'
MTQGIFPDSLSKIFFNIRDQFLRKLQACSTPLDLNDDSKQVK